MRVSAWLRGVAAVLVGLVVVVMTAWAVGAICYQALTGYRPAMASLPTRPTGPVVGGAGAAR